MPQELEVWYILPSLRKELARIFVRDYNLSQKMAAQFLGLTEPAVSQYLKSKRGGEINFSKDEIVEVKKTAGKIVKNPKNSREYFYALSSKLRGSKSMCILHKKREKDLPMSCKLCRISY